MKINKKELLFIIFYTIALFFAFWYIKYVCSFFKYLLFIFKPFIIGIFVAYVLNVLVSLIENKWFKNWNISKNSKRAISILLALFIIIFFFGLLLFLIIPSIQNNLTIFADNIPRYISEFKNILVKMNIDSNIINQVMSSLKNMGDNFSAYVINNSDKVISTMLGIASNVATGLVNFIIGLVFAIYFIVEKEKICETLKKIMKAYFPNKFNEKIISIAKLSNKTFANFISGQCVEAMVLGILCFIGMIILRLPFASVISIIIAFTALIPVFGAFLGILIGFFLIFAINPIQAIIFVIFVILLQQFEGNVIYPKVVGKKIGLPGILVLVAVSVGASIDGAFGMLLSVPITSILYSILITNVNYRLKNK